MNNAMPVVSIGGNKDLSGEVVDLRIRHDLNTTSMCTIRAVDHDRLLAETYLGKIGEKVTISLSDTTCFSGLIVEVGTEQHPNALPHLMIRCLDPSFLLSHQAFHRSFENQSYTKAVKQLVTDAKLAGSDLSADLDKFAPPYVLQEGTNLAFLEDICLRTGTRWHVRDDKLHVRSATVATHTLVAEPDGAKNSPKLVVQSFNASYSSTPHAKSVDVRAWDQATSAEVVSTVTWPKARDNGLATLAEAKAAKLVGDPLVIAAAAAASVDEAKALGGGVAERMASEATRVRGVLVDPGPKLMVDDAAKIEGFGKVSGTYTITRVEHRYGLNRPFQTEFHAGYRPPTVLGGAAAPGSEAMPRRYQLDIGVVSDIADETGATRVKVSYPTRDGKLVSGWARLLGLGAGPKRGMHWVPEVGDEVIVGYLGGDARHPVVIGGLWTADDASAPGAAADVVKSGAVVTRSITSRLGSMFQFSDGDSDETTHIKFGLTDKAMPFVRLGADKVDLEAASGKPIKFKAGDTTVEIDANGGVVITAKDISLKADNDIKIEGNKVTIKGNSGVDVDGGGSKLALKPGQAEVSSSGTTAVKGTAVQLN